jgi:SAM-dependent methyltransferase
MMELTVIGDQFAKYEAENSPVRRPVGLANGTVLELGPGTGGQFPGFDRTAVSRIYGIEPNKYLFDQLRNETIRKHGLADIYIPINGPLEDEKHLESFGIVSGSIDTIVCTQVLCSVSDVSEAVKQIHRLLKPGGQLLFWEHTGNRDMGTRWVQG